MKQANTGNQTSLAKGHSPSKEVNEYLAGVPEPARSTLKKVRATIRSAVPPDTVEGLSYGIPTFKYKGPLVGFGAFSRHCSLFPMSAAVIQAFETELKDFETSKGTIRFAIDKPLPAALLKKLVRARLAENERRRQRRSSSP